MLLPAHVMLRPRETAANWAMAIRCLSHPGPGRASYASFDLKETVIHFDGARSEGIEGGRRR